MEFCGIGVKLTARGNLTIKSLKRKAGAKDSFNRHIYTDSILVFELVKFMSFIFTFCAWYL